MTKITPETANYPAVRETGKEWRACRGFKCRSCTTHVYYEPIDGVCDHCHMTKIARDKWFNEQLHKK